MSEKTIALFWEKVNKNGPFPSSCPELGRCWLWTASRRHKGYGAFSYRVDGGIINDRAHRFSFILHGGVFDKGECVLHHCDVPQCVNPAHLFSGTKADNNKDMHEKGRHIPGATHVAACKCKYKRGVDHHNAKITPEVVKRIRNEHDAGMSFSELGKKHNLNSVHIYRIVRRKRWAHVE